LGCPHDEDALKQAHAQETRIVESGLDEGSACGSDKEHGGSRMEYERTLGRIEALCQLELDFQILTLMALALKIGLDPRLGLGSWLHHDNP
jgi:hypothetical protein